MMMFMVKIDNEIQFFCWRIQFGFGFVIGVIYFVIDIGVNGGNGISVFQGFNNQGGNGGNNNNVGG